MKKYCDTNGKACSMCGDDKSEWPVWVRHPIRGDSKYTPTATEVAIFYFSIFCVVALGFLVWLLLQHGDTPWVVKVSIGTSIGLFVSMRQLHEKWASSFQRVDEPPDAFIKRISGRTIPLDLGGAFITIATSVIVAVGAGNILMK